MKSTSLVGLLLGLVAYVAPLAPAAAQQPPQIAASAAQNLPPCTRPGLDPTKWLTASGNLHWPSDGGFAHAPVDIVLPTGMLIDRFGDTSGHFFSPEGAAYSTRALPFTCQCQTYIAFKVDRPLAVKSGTAAPWFDEPGGAIQYETRETVSDLLNAGVIEVAPDAGPAPCDGR